MEEDRGEMVPGVPPPVTYHEMRHFTPARVLTVGAPCEFWDDLEYMESMDTAWHHWQQPKWDAARGVWNGQRHTPTTP